MKRSNGSDLPKARSNEIFTRELPGELLIYDIKRHKAYCLNETAASVWKSCNGRRTVTELTHQLETQYQVSVDERMVRLALNQLEKGNLLDSRVGRPPRNLVVSRRDLISSLGLTTAIALPVVVSIIAPTAAQAATCAGKIPTAQCDNVSKVGCCCTDNRTCTQTSPGVFNCVSPAC